MSNADKCELLNSSQDLEKALKSREKFIVLFYASWCPYSQIFLPVFVKDAEESEHCYMRMIVDDKDELLDKYSIEVFPTVLYFEKGKLVKRLDGKFHIGLNKVELAEFVKKCGLKDKKKI